MTSAALWLMVIIGLVAGAIGAGLLLTAPARRRPQTRYVSRLAGVMFAAVGLILIVYVAAWRSF
ncbi:hypothetical protein ABC347_01885 [Sphingomonas sp. 1P06PA]|uniref:hypothetical protein n=1 Tax=Sphingomonas sp. 1P06PA TaxID=554121 RepID=UPI0039A5F40B